MQKGKSMETMKIMAASMKDLDGICTVTEQAKQQLRNMGLDQWQKGYPSREIWEQDIRNQCCYIMAEGEKILGAFMFQETPDVSYYKIDGQWLTDGAYASMHRVCVADGARGKGIAGRMFAHGFRMAREKGFPSVRIDTHPQNLPMQNALKKSGFQACGTIVLAEGGEKGDLRIAFERLLDQ